jgi:hypothetical protein
LVVVDLTRVLRQILLLARSHAYLPWGFSSKLINTKGRPLDLMEDPIENGVAIPTWPLKKCLMPNDNNIFLSQKQRKASTQQSQKHIRNALELYGR